MTPEPNVVVRPVPRLGRGLAWSTIVAEIEREQQSRPAPGPPACRGRLLRAIGWILGGQS